MIGIFAGLLLIVCPGFVCWGRKATFKNRKPKAEPLNLKSVSGVFICLQGSGSWVSGQHTKKAGQRDKDLRRPRKDTTKTVPVRGKGLDRARKPRCVFLPFAACSKGKAARQAGRGPPHCWRETRGRQTGQSMATLVTTAHREGRQNVRGELTVSFLTRSSRLVCGTKPKTTPRGKETQTGQASRKKIPRENQAGGKRQGRQVGKRPKDRTRQERAPIQVAKKPGPRNPKL